MFDGLACMAVSCWVKYDKSFTKNYASAETASELQAKMLSSVV